MAKVFVFKNKYKEKDADPEFNLYIAEKRKQTEEATEVSDEDMMNT